jgi:hypothetical protein
MVHFGPHRVYFGMQLGPVTPFFSQSHMRAPCRCHPRYMDIIGYGIVDRRPDQTMSEDLGGFPVLYRITFRTELLDCLQMGMPDSCGSGSIRIIPSSEISTLQFVTYPLPRRTLHFIGSLREILSLISMLTSPTIPPLGRSIFWATSIPAPEIYRYLSMIGMRMHFVFSR